MKGQGEWRWAVQKLTLSYSLVHVGKFLIGCLEFCYNGKSLLFPDCDQRTAELLKELRKLWWRLPVACPFSPPCFIINLDFQLGRLCPT